MLLLVAVPLVSGVLRQMLGQRLGTLAGAAAAGWLVFWKSERWQDAYRARMTAAPWHSHVDERGHRRPCRIPAHACARWATETEEAAAA